MKYSGMPSFMWKIYHKSFRVHLVSDLAFSEENAKRICKQAKPKYREIIVKIPEFEKEDRFKTNAVNCALLISFLQCMDRRPSVEELTVYYANAMSTWMTEMFCRKSGKKKFTKCGICALMKKYGFYDLTPAMCHLDYVMSEMDGVSVFKREYTLASGGANCDNGYKKMR